MDVRPQTSPVTMGFLYDTNENINQGTEFANVPTNRFTTLTSSIVPRSYSDRVYLFAYNGDPVITVKNVILMVGVEEEPDMTPVFTGADGETLTGLTSTKLNVILPYKNESAVDVDLTMLVAVYSPDGKLAHLATSAKKAAADEVTEFDASLDMPGNVDGVYEAQGYSAAVFLWDSVSYVPEMSKLVPFQS